MATDADIPDTLTIVLRKPVDHAGQVYDRIELREPTAAELVQMSRVNGTEGDIFALSLIGGVPKGAIEKIGARDLLTGARFLGGFLLDVPKAGDVSSIS
ncbi:MAG: phage tail assembly protein [Sphingomonadaceae bacterium]|nr:phage tail assembly protein [Sphingomonadaceae bacterium]